MKIPDQGGSQSVPCPCHTRNKRVCGQNTRVVRTKRMPTGVTERTRKCPRGHRFTTEEKPA